MANQNSIARPSCHLEKNHDYGFKNDVQVLLRRGLRPVLKYVHNCRAHGGILNLGGKFFPSAGVVLRQPKTRAFSPTISFTPPNVGPA